MDLQNTTLDDIAAEIGFSATLRLVAWFGDDGNCYVPVNAEDGQLLATLIGLPAARALSARWPGEHLNIPVLSDFEVAIRRGTVAKLLAAGLTTREISHILRVGERRVQQICRELELAGLIDPVGPPKRSKGQDTAWWLKTGGGSGS